VEVHGSSWVPRCLSCSGPGSRSARASARQQIEPNSPKRATSEGVKQKSNADIHLRLPADRDIWRGNRHLKYGGPRRSLSPCRSRCAATGARHSDGRWPHAVFFKLLLMRAAPATPEERRASRPQPLVCQGSLACCGGKAVSFKQKLKLPPPTWCVVVWHRTQCAPKFKPVFLCAHSGSPIIQPRSKLPAVAPGRPRP
jgi:hypothetical protein